MPVSAPASFPQGSGCPPSNSWRKRGDGAPADDAFHHAVAAASHNPYLSRFVEFLGHQFSDTRRPVWTPEGHRLGRPQAARREHEILFAAIAAGNVRGAGRAAAAHLRRSASRLGLQGPGRRR